MHHLYRTYKMEIFPEINLRASTEITVDTRTYLGFGYRNA